MGRTTHHTADGSVIVGCGTLERVAITVRTDNADIQIWDSDLTASVPTAAVARLIGRYVVRFTSPGTTQDIPIFDRFSKGIYMEVVTGTTPDVFVCIG